MEDPTLGLKVMAPILRRGHYFRLWLDQYLHRHEGCQLIVVEAPPGYGKTMLLAQWRRTLMAGGAMTAWLTLDDRDDEGRVIEGMVLSIRQSTGRNDFSLGDNFSERDPDLSMKRISSMLSEWAALARPLVLILDDMDRVTSPKAVWALDYLIRNLPSNCRLFIGTRPLQERESIVDLQSYGKAALLNQRELAFTLEETIAFFNGRFPELEGSNVFSMIHRQTEGWPVGLEIACNRLEFARNQAPGTLETLDFASDIRHFFIEKTAGTLSDQSRAMLIDIAMLDQFNKDLVVAVTGKEEARDLIDSLRATSALITEVEGGIWFRFHQLALDHLRSQLILSAKDRLLGVHLRAAKWFALHSFWDEAARHALHAGDDDLANDYAKKGLLSTLRAGKLDVVAQWLRRLPDAE
ncbi:MAG: hypothetical protein Q7U84_05580, partial [Polynucleobacter sp.]|nr:hypothetical protein [Polynucleobacter sp.]